MSNVEDSLMTKDNLTYEQCYQRLMDSTITTETNDDKAYATTITGRGKAPATRSVLDARQAPPQDR